MLGIKFSHKGKSRNMTKYALWLIILLIPLIFGLLAVHLGKDINWDLKNYHYYNAYAFLTNRLTVDIAPAMLQTFYNPLLDIPFYWMTIHFSSRWTGFILGGVHGLNLVLVFLIFWEIAQFSQKWVKVFAGICLLIMTGIAPGFISELGSTMNDNLTCLFVLTALFILIIGFKRMQDEKVWPGVLCVILAGIVMGAGVGLKETVAVYAVGSAVALFFYPTSWRKRIIRFILYGFSGLIGAMLSGGYWWWTLWSQFKNPFFPYFNNIFKSPFIKEFSFDSLSHSYLPHNLFEYFSFPVVFSINSHRVSSIQFQDVRFGLIYILTISWLVVSVVRAIRSKNIKQPETKQTSISPNLGNFLLLFIGISFVVWMIEFSIYRYLIPVELLIPLGFFIITERLFQSRRVIVLGLVLTAMVVLILFEPYSWGRVPWSDPYFQIDTTLYAKSSPAGAMVIMLGQAPTAYVIPMFPQNFRFVRPEGNLGLRVNDGFFKEIRAYP